jgi:hypothetical protein
MGGGSICRLTAEMSVDPKLVIVASAEAANQVSYAEGDGSSRVWRLSPSPARRHPVLHLPPDGAEGLFDVERRLEAISAKGDPLETIKKVVPWKLHKASQIVIEGHSDFLVVLGLDPASLYPLLDWHWADGWINGSTGTSRARWRRGGFLQVERIGSTCTLSSGRGAQPPRMRCPLEACR